MKFGVIVFPGTWSDVNCHYALDKIIGQPVSYIWHRATSLAGYDCVIVPDNLSFGECLRAGATARFAPIMAEVQRFARRGGLVFGICNGFQMLCECGLLPGCLMTKKDLESRYQPAHLRVENTSSPFTCRCQKGQVLQVPVSQRDGHYRADEDTLRQLEDNGQIALRYCSPEGEVTRGAAPDGSLQNIAGIINMKGNVLGMVPHPGRVCGDARGVVDGSMLFQSLVANWQGRVKA